MEPLFSHLDTFSENFKKLIDELSNKKLDILRLG